MQKIKEERDNLHNNQRPHAKNGYKTPLKKELDVLNGKALSKLKSN